MLIQHTLKPSRSDSTTALDSLTECLGFVSNQVLRPVNDGDPYVVFTLWESRKDFENWVESDEFRKGHAQSGTLPKEAFTGSNKLELHEVFLDSSRPDLKEEPSGGPFNVH